MRLNKKFCLLALTLISVGGNFAQMSFGLSVSPLVGFSKSASFSTYRDYYNTTNAPTLKKDLSSGSFTYGYDANLEFTINHLYTGVSVTNTFTRSSAKFENEASRHFQQHQRYINTLIGYINRNESREFTIATGISISDYFITTHVNYPNGDKDYTYGIVFGSNHTVAIGVPLVFGYGISLNEKWWLVARAQMQFTTKDNFTFFSNTGSVVYNGGELVGDAFRGFLTIGLKRTFNL